MTKGYKQRRTILREARRNILSLDDDEYLDAMVVLEDAMKHHYVKAARLKAKDEDDPKVDHHLKEAAGYAVDIMPYRHHKLATLKFEKDPVIGGLGENASLEELEAEMKKHWARLAPVLDLEAMLALPKGNDAASEPSDGIANREVQEE